MSQEARGPKERMKNILEKLFIAACVLACPAGALGAVTLPAIFGDKMVLQRQLPLPIWGTAEPGEKISVSFAGQDIATVADDQGKWIIKLKPLKTSRTERTMTIKGSNTVTFSGVLVGEVWLCSGQSNMAGKFVKSKGRSIDPRAFKQDLSRFRFSARQGWMSLTPRSQKLLSCVAYYFGIELYRKLDIPIGLIQRYNSGTPIQTWMPKDAAELIRKKLNIPQGWNNAHPMQLPGFQFNDKIAPIVPMAFRGVIWYQGERNAKSQTGWEYGDLLSFHIKTWRDLWAKRAGIELRKFPFYYVQVPTQESPVDAEWPWLRDAMRRALDTTENTGMAIFYDYGPSLHPENKQPAGKRLSLWALAKDYGRDKLVHCGPLLDKVLIKKGKAVLTFKHVGGGLRNASGGKQLKFFEIAARDGKYVPAEAIIEGANVIVQNPKVAKPVYVRYLFRKPTPNAEVSLINAEGLPASSFMTDDFKPPRPAVGAKAPPKREHRAGDKK
jgi:sialate O-acetylesterase